MIYRDERHQHTFEKEAAMRPESISRALLAALYLLTADKNLWNQVKGPHQPAPDVCGGYAAQESHGDQLRLFCRR